MKWTQGSVAAWTAAAALTLLTLPVQADVVNGGFETGSLAGWTLTGDTSFSGVDPFAARSGNYGAFFGPTVVGGISQSFATLANTVYKIDFSLSLADSAQPNSFSWSWNGVAQAPALSNAAGFGYTNFSALLLATGTTTTIAFNFVNPQSFWLLDNVGVAAIPEPSVTLLMGAGFFVMLAGMQRRARSKKA